ncbi:MAG: hypothetical protein MJ106_04725 [Lentisphaeria bacterium]|nr:hypothetical protein [Lentisphaeria bacterium]
MNCRVCTVIVSLSLLLLADNNIVTNLKVTHSASGSAFTLPRDGWVRLEGELPKEVVFQSEKNSVSVLSHNDVAVAWLENGDYTINTTVKSAKRIGNNMFYQMCGHFDTNEMVHIPTDRKTSGRAGMFLYNWNFLRENVLDAFPVLLLNAPMHPEITKWKAEGRRIIGNSGVYPDAKQCLAHWEEASVPGRDGFTTDEFVIPAGLKDPSDAALGYTNPGSGFKQEIFDAMKEWHQKHTDMTLWAWLGLPWDALSEDSRPLLKTLDEINGVLLWESYANTRDWRGEFDLRYRQRIDGFRKAAGDYSRIVVAPGTYEFLDINAYVDFKVFLEMQVNLVANNPSMKNLGGISLWTSYYTDPEILRWYTLLVNHYAVEGKTEMLSPKFGFTIENRLLKNAEWESLGSWKCFGKTSLVKANEAGLPASPYYPHSTANMLRLESCESGATQIVKGLMAGRMYSVSTLFVDPTQDGGEILYDAEILVDGAEVVESRTRQLNDFLKPDKPTFNHIKTVFKATSDSVSITVKRGEKSKGTPPLFVDSIHFMPYFNAAP